VSDLGSVVAMVSSEISPMGVGLPQMTLEGSGDAARGGLLASVGVLVSILCGCGDGGIAAKTAGPASCTGAIPASKAWDHRLEVVTVRGVVISARSHDSTYFGDATLYLSDAPGESEPDLTVIVPDEDRGNFPAPVGVYLGKTICAAGLIGGYQPANMVVSLPDRIAIAP
jgi:hypothetical protein